MCSTTPAMRSTGRSTSSTRSGSPRTSSSTSWAPHQRQLGRGARCRSGPGRSARRADRPRHRRRGGGNVPTPKGATRRSRRTLIQAGRAASRSTSPRASSLSGAGRSATTSTSPSARATCRPTRCRWRSPTGRSRTAARSCARTSGSSRGPPGRAIQEIEPAPRRHVEIDPAWQRAIMSGLRDAAMLRRDLIQGLRWLAGRDRRQDRDGGAPPHLDQAWYIALAPYDDPNTWSR